MNPSASREDDCGNLTADELRRERHRLAQRRHKEKRKQKLLELETNYRKAIERNALLESRVQGIMATVGELRKIIASQAREIEALRLEKIRFRSGGTQGNPGENDNYPNYSGDYKRKDVRSEGDAYSSGAESLAMNMQNMVFSNHSLPQKEEGYSTTENEFNSLEEDMLESLADIEHSASQPVVKVEGGEKFESWDDNDTIYLQAPSSKRYRTNSFDEPLVVGKPTPVRSIQGGRSCDEFDPFIFPEPNRALPPDVYKTHS